MNSPVKYLLLPFAWLYGAGIVARNWLFDLQILKSRSFDVPVIGIGNLSAGGTGKTPMAEYILKLLLANGYKSAYLSRGYQRQSKGFVEVKQDSYSRLAGDEPYQVKCKFPEVFVAVCEDRAKGIETIRAASPETNVIVLDDSYQHRRAKPGFSILLTDYGKPWHKDFLLPAGRLREPASGRKRADMVIVTKCPENLGQMQKDLIKQKLRVHNRQHICFTSIAYQWPEKAGQKNAPEGDISPDGLKNYKTVLFTGIANTLPLETWLKSRDAAFVLIKYPDHHVFSVADVEKIIRKWHETPGTDKIMVTTEKDWRRLEGTPEAGLFSKLPLYYIPIEVGWDVAEKDNFDRTLLKYVGTNKRSG